MEGAHDKSAPQRQKLSGEGEGLLCHICGPLSQRGGQGVGGRGLEMLSGRRLGGGVGVGLRPLWNTSFQLGLKLIQRRWRAKAPHLATQAGP